MLTNGDAFPDPSVPPTTPQPPPSGLAGVVATGGIGIQALLGTNPLTLFDSDKGATGNPVGFPGGDRVNAVYHVGATPVIASWPACKAAQPEKCEPNDVFVYLGPGTPPRSLGKAYSLAPGADGQSVWLMRRDAPNVCRIQHVKLTGEEFGPGSSASCNTGLREETKHGLLITINSGSAEYTDVLIDPDSGRTIQQAPQILAIVGDFMLLNGLAELTLVDLRDGSRKQLSGWSGHYPSMVPSPDGHLIAVDFANPAWRATNIEVRDVWLLHLDTLEWQHAPGMPYTTENLKNGGLGWNAAGDVVLLDDVFAAWHPGEPAWRLGKAKAPKQTGGDFLVLN